MSASSSQNDVVQLPEMLAVLQSSLSQMKWRLRPSSKRRLETDVLALMTEMRPVVMVDYGGKMPELQERLCSFLSCCRNELPVFEVLKVMVMEDMIYLVHAKAFAEFVELSLSFDTGNVLVDIEQDPPKIVLQNDGNSAAEGLVSIQRKFSVLFKSNAGENEALKCEGEMLSSNASSCSEPSGIIDLSSWIQESEVTIPTLNGWLLGYPVVYFFGKDHIEDAIYNLSTKSLNIYQILISRSGVTGGGSGWEELMSFSVPCELSLEGRDEPWAKAFLIQMQAKVDKCEHVWGSLKMKVMGCYPQAIVL